MTFLGRAAELQKLRAENWRGSAELVVLYGRRRVGKTTLVERAFKQRRMWRFDALEGQKLSAQLSHFHARLLEVATVPAEHARGFTTWQQALAALSLAVARNADDPLVVFWDEFQWAAEMRGYLVSLVKSFWDRELSRHRKLKFVLCGSISSFMVKRVIRSKALFGRVDTEIDLKPLRLTEMRDLCSAFGSRDEREVLDIALTLGGIPAYLRQLHPQWSFEQNINEQAFQPHGYFFGEFDRIFVSHFGANPNYRKVVDTLRDAPHTADQLAGAAGHATGGGFKSLLDDLRLAGLIERYTPLDKSDNSKLVRFRIVDEYIHFYTRFIAPNRREIESGHFSTVLGFTGPTFDQWRGYAFERLCRRHQRLIADALKFSAVRYRFGTWFKRHMPNVPGAQIDLLFVRADRVITLCEAKVGPVDARALQRALTNKLAALRAQFPRHGIHTVLVVPKSDMVSANARQHVHDVLPLLDP